jgi:hypothetical protein
MKRLLDHIPIIFYGNSALLVLFIFTIFFIPLFPGSMHRFLFGITYTSIFFLTILALESQRRLMFILAIIAMVAEWVTEVSDWKLLYFFSTTARIVFFSITVVKIIIQIARTENVNRNTILEAVNGYLLLGILFALLVGYLIYISPGAFGAETDNDFKGTDIIYFTFVTMSTLGYGDITPVLSGAKSLSIFISISGQIYLTTILALLVGKFASQAKKSEDY